MARIYEFNRRLEVIDIDVEDVVAKTAHLTSLQFGMVMLLLIHCGTTGRRLPDDDKELAAITGVSQREWRKNRAEVMALFDHGRPLIGFR